MIFTSCSFIYTIQNDVLQCVLGLKRGVQTMTFSWLMKCFKKQRWRIRRNLNHYESEKNIRNYVSKCKISRKKDRKDFNGRSKNVLVKNKSSPTNSTPGSVRISSAQQHPQKCLVASDTFDDNQASSAILINIEKTND